MLKETVLAALLIGVYDGDTFTAAVENWPNQVVTTGVRVDGIDTPERGWRAECDEERALAEIARNEAEAFLAEGVIVLKDVRTGKYANRIIADVYVDGRSLAEHLKGLGVARPYDGGARLGWC